MVVTSEAFYEKFSITVTWICQNPLVNLWIFQQYLECSWTQPEWNISCASCKDLLSAGCCVCWRSLVSHIKRTQVIVGIME